MSAVDAPNYAQRLDEVLRPFPSRANECEEPGLPPAPVWPDGKLPPAFERYVAAAARSIGVPPEMIAVPLLVTAGAMIGNRVHIILKRGFVQYPTLFAAVIAEPGSAKTPAMLAAQWPMSQLQRENVELYKQQLAEYEVELEAYLAKPKDERGTKPAKPALQHLYSSDLTLEALVGMLSNSPGVAILRDEILSWVTSLDQYRGGKGSDRQQYLSLWSGSPIKSDRAGRETIYAANPVACVFGGIQPDALTGLHDPNGRRDGWIERLLLFFPEVRPTGWTDDELDPQLAEPLVDAFRRLRNGGRGDSAQPLGVQLSSGAKAVWREWYDDNEATTDVTRGLRRGFYSKLPNQVARLALILHTIWNLDDPLRMVSRERMQDAIDLGEFFRSHLDRVLPLIGDSSRDESVGLPGRIIRILRKESLDTSEGWIRRGVLLNRLRNVSADTLSEALSELQDEDRVESRPVQTATKPAEEWRIKPQTPFGNSDYSDYSVQSGDSPNNPNSPQRRYDHSEDDDVVDMSQGSIEL
jgi:hypothetical protein